MEFQKKSEDLIKEYCGLDEPELFTQEEFKDILEDNEEYTDFYGNKKLKKDDIIIILDPSSETNICLLKKELLKYWNSQSKYGTYYNEFGHNIDDEMFFELPPSKYIPLNIMEEIQNDNMNLKVWTLFTKPVKAKIGKTYNEIYIIQPSVEYKKENERIKTINRKLSDKNLELYKEDELKNFKLKQDIKQSRSGIRRLSRIDNNEGNRLRHREEQLSQLKANSKTSKKELEKELERKLEREDRKRILEKELKIKAIKEEEIKAMKENEEKKFEEYYKLIEQKNKEKERNQQLRQQKSKEEEEQKLENIEKQLSINQSLLKSLGL